MHHHVLLQEVSYDRISSNAIPPCIAFALDIKLTQQDQFLYTYNYRLPISRESRDRGANLPRDGTWKRLAPESCPNDV